MVEAEPAYSKTKAIINSRFLTLGVFHLRPGGTEPRHFHNGTEIVYVLEGNCETYEKGQFYRQERGDVHDVVNDSPNEVVFVRLSIPRDTPANKIYV